MNIELHKCHVFVFLLQKMSIQTHRLSSEFSAAHEANVFLELEIPSLVVNLRDFLRSGGILFSRFLRKHWPFPLLHWLLTSFSFAFSHNDAGGTST